MTEDILADAIKKALVEKAKRVPGYKVYYGKEVLTADEAAARMDTDPEFRKYMVTRYGTLAVDLAKEEHE